MTAFALSEAPISTATDFVSEKNQIVAITNVTIFDGTGALPKTEQTVVIDHGRIAAVGPRSVVLLPTEARMIDGTGKTVIPGLVGMHEHMFSVSPIAGTPVSIEQFVSYPALYLASGVTWARTAGSMDPYADLEIRRGIEAGTRIGPALDLTTPYLQSAGGPIGQMHMLTGAEDARSLVRYWHSQSFTSVKAYSNLSPEELNAGIDEAHKLGMKVTGHLCSVGYEQAIAFGIDNLEHGPFLAPDGDLDSSRVPGTCLWDDHGVKRAGVRGRVAATMELDSPELARLIHLMVEKHIPLTSTLAVAEGGSKMVPGQMTRLKALLHPVAWDRVNELFQSEISQDSMFQMQLRKEMGFERAFVKAGGMLMVGCDPTGDGHVIAGLGDQRNIELLVEAGFTLPEAIRFATLNGAIYEGIAGEVGSIERGKRADLVLLDGDLANDVTVMERPEIVFKNGLGYDSQAIYRSLAGQVGLH